MKRILLILSCLILLAGCSSSRQSAKPKNGVIIIPYEKPVDFKQFEVFVSTTPAFNPTGWDGSAWAGQPNAPAEWNGADKTLFMVTTNDPIQVTGLTPGKTYYAQVVVVDKSNQRSIPSPEIEAVAGDAQRSSTLVVAAADASPRSKAGADYLCDGINDQDTFNEAINEAVTQNPGVMVTIKGTEGTYNITASIFLQSNVTLDVLGTIRILDGTTTTFSAIKNADTTNGNSNINIKNVVIDGNKQNISSGDHIGIQLRNVQKFLIDKVRINNFRSHGIFIMSALDGVISKTTSSINGIYAGNDQATGIYVYDSNSITITNSEANNNGGAGILLRGSKGTIEGCRAEQNHPGIWLEYATNAVVSGCQSHNNLTNGIYVHYSDDCIINGNQCTANGQEQNNTYANIFNSGGTRNNYQQNVCRKGTGTNQPNHGLSNSGGTYLLITGNDCYTGGASAGISSAHATTNFGAGNRNNDGTWSTTPN